MRDERQKEKKDDERSMKQKKNESWR